MAALPDPTTDKPAASARFRRAAEAHDVDGVIETLAPDAVLYSPITTAVEFRGRDEIRKLLHAVFAEIRDIRYFADLGDDRTRALFYRASVGGYAVEEATRIELDDDGRIKEITLFFRPLAGLARLTAGLGPRVARRHGPLRSLLAIILLAPLRLIARVVDPLAAWLT